MKSIFRFILGFISGMLLGSALAVLLAPSSGEQLRFEISNRAKNIQDEVNRAAAQRRAELEAQLDTLRSVRRGN